MNRPHDNIYSKKAAENTNSFVSPDNDEVKSKSNSIEIPSISLPNFGGVVNGIDEKFSVYATNVPIVFSIRLPCSQQFLKLNKDDRIR